MRRKAIGVKYIMAKKTFGTFWKKNWKSILVGFLVLLVAAQFVPVDRSAPPSETEVPAPPEVRAVLKRACYDCHSNETVWPWYSKIAPVSWLIARDVHVAREEMNYTAWNRLSPKKQAKRFKQSWTLVEEGEMPMSIYIPLHPEAKLTDADKALIKEWALSMAQGVAPQGTEAVPEEDSH
jgi:hypothetical protein